MHNVNREDRPCWTVENAKSRLRMFLYRNSIIAHFKYTTLGTRRKRRHEAFMAFTVPQVNKSFQARERACTNSLASKKAALSLILHLRYSGLIKVASSQSTLAKVKINKVDVARDDDSIVWSPPVPNWNTWSARPMTTMPSDTAQATRSILLGEEMLNDSQCLPIFKCKEEILSAISRKKIVLLEGQTGSGKSTQVPQFILDHFIEANEGASCNIIVTQPRRICATSLAKRVAQERSEPLGVSVGYSVRFDTIFPRPHGAILYCTVGTLLRRIKKSFHGISHLLIDEIHERDLKTDFLLTVIKTMVNQGLRVVLMSASVNIDMFANFFPGAITISCRGSLHPVKVCYLEEIQQFLGLQWQRNCKELSLEFFERLIIKISAWCRGGLLIFLPGWKEIITLADFLSRKLNGAQYDILMLHSKFQDDRIFEPSSKTKIIISTNIAESSITLRDIVFVIDSCKLPEHAQLKMDVEDIQDLIVTTKILGLRTVFSEMLEPPTNHDIETAEARLEELGVLEQGVLTLLGALSARLPIPARLALVVIQGCILNCGDAMVTFAAMHDSMQDLQGICSKRKHGVSDHVEMLRFFQDWEEAVADCEGRAVDLCMKSEVRPQAIHRIGQIKKQLKQILVSIGFPVPEPYCYRYFGPDPNLDVVISLLAMGLYPNVCMRLGKRNVLRTKTESAVIAASSVVYAKKDVIYPSQLFVCSEKVRSKGSVSCHHMTMVTPVQLLLFASKYTTTDGQFVKLDDWIDSKMKINTASSLASLRITMNELVETTVNNPTSRTAKRLELIRAVKAINL